jgi:hypothetical protein
MQNLPLKDLKDGTKFVKDGVEYTKVGKNPALMDMYVVADEYGILESWANIIVKAKIEKPREWYMKKFVELIKGRSYSSERAATQIEMYVNIIYTNFNAINPTYNIEGDYCMVVSYNSKRFTLVNRATGKSASVEMIINKREHVYDMIETLYKRYVTNIPQ